MPASMKRAIASPLLVLVLVSILSPMQGKHVGQSCVIDNSPGVCTLLENCPKVYTDLVAGKAINESCGVLGYEPIVCCPSTKFVNKPTPAPQPHQTTVRLDIMRPLKLDRAVGSVARTQCAENAMAVYGFEVPPTPILDRKPYNKSLCGLKTRKLIIGGEKAEAKEFPHMAAIGFDGPNNEIVWNCGGSLISAKVVLTAAHCTWSLNWGTASWVRVGDLNLAQTNDNAKPQTIAVKESIKHPDYRRPSEYHDIAILRLKQEVTYNAWVRPACLPVSWPDVSQIDKAIATGWGLVDLNDENASDELMKVTLNLIPHESCNASFFDGGSSVNEKFAFGIVNEWQICAGEIGKDTCQGDSGGPLAIFNTVHDCMYDIIGITSFGQFCGSTGVYTRVYNYISWIEKTAWPEYF